MTTSKTEPAGSRPVITVIGSLNIDMVTYTPRIPLGGETMTANSFHVGLGGKGANQAVACAKVSRSQDDAQQGYQGTADVRMVGAVGSDAYGTTMVEGLGKYGVDVSGVRRQDGANTGVAVILVEESTGDNRIMLSAEANQTLRPGDFRCLPPGPRPDLIIMQLEIPMDTVLRIMELAKEEDIPVLLNPAPAQRLPSDKHYSAVTHLVVNESEAVILSGCEEADLKTEKGLQRVASDFIARGVRNVLITLGGSGVYYASAAGRHGLVPAEKVKVVDTTAAGDTFVGVYALEAVKKDFDIEQAVRQANRAAARTVQVKGAQDSIPWRDELDCLQHVDH